MTRALVFGALLAGCAAPKSAPPAPSSAPLAALIAASGCPAVEGRTFAFASVAQGPQDTFVLVKRCRARADADAVALSADAYAWVAIDREMGGIALHQFVHATLHAEIRARVSARDDGKHLLVTLVPDGTPMIAVEPVGALEPAAQNWATLIAIELAPSVGVSPEAAAKQRVKAEAEKTLRTALAQPITVPYAAGDAPPVRGRYRVAPRGTVVEGPFPAMFAGTTAHAKTRGKVVIKAICATHASHLLDADRRGDRITLDDWPVVDGEALVAIPALACPWVIAMRSEAPAEVVLDPPVLGAPRPVRAVERWVSIDSLTFEKPLEDGRRSVVASTELWSYPIGATDDPKRIPAVLVLAPDEELRVRIVRKDADGPVVEAQEPVILDAEGEVTRTIVLKDQDGVPATLHLKARVHAVQRP